MERWTPEAEEAFRQGFLMGSGEDNRSWHVIGFSLAAFSGFLMGVAVTLVALSIFR